MRTFFKGWRRKVGCATLVMALVFMGGWIRSLTRQDIIEFCPAKSIYCLSSGHAYFGVMRFDFPSRAEAMMLSSVSVSPLQSLCLGWYSAVLTETVTTLEPWAGAKSESHWKMGEFYWGTASIASVQRFDKVYVIVPYWSLTVPLTLLSAYLILWKPRKRAGDSATV